jgi:hypothetical protein
MLLPSGAIFTVKKPSDNSGIPEPAKGPVIPHFPRPLNFRGHNFRKMRNRAGIIQRVTMGTYEVEYSNVTKSESRMECGLGRGGDFLGYISASSPEGIRD